MRKIKQAFQPKPIHTSSYTKNILRLGQSNSSTLVSTPSDTEIQNRAVCILKPLSIEIEKKNTTNEEALDIDTDITLYNVKNKSRCMHTRVGATNEVSGKKICNFFDDILVASL